MVKETTVASNPKKKPNAFIKGVRQYWQIWVFILPTLVYYIVFAYMPMYGAQIAFKDFIPIKGITGSPWVGFKHFIRFFESPYFGEIMGNTIIISLYSLCVGFPIPIIFALLLNYQRNQKFKKIVQTVSYAPHFISTVVMVGMLLLMLSPSTGIVNTVIEALGGQRINFMGEAKMFRHIYVWSGVWQGMGYNAIIYIGALTAISPELHEAAKVDGATIWKRILHIDIPGIMPTIIILLIMQTGSLLSVGFEKTYLMQNNINSKYSEVISTYVYKTGLSRGQFSYGSAIGLFNSAVNFAILATVNAISNKVGSSSLF